MKGMRLKEINSYMDKRKGQGTPHNYEIKSPKTKIAEESFSDIDPLVIEKIRRRGEKWDREHTSLRRAIA